MQRTDFTCSVGYDVDIPCVFMTWKGYATTPLFREANERVLACLQEHHASKLLGDVSDFVLIAGVDQDWLNAEWIPRAIDAGLRRAAIVQPTFYFNRVAVETVRQRTDPERLSVGFFDTADAARAWLRASGTAG
jgi:hypothetical protein